MWRCECSVKPLFACGLLLYLGGKLQRKLQSLRPCENEDSATQKLLLAVWDFAQCHDFSCTLLRGVLPGSR